jgi:copper(I)-binding protein
MSPHRTAILATVVAALALVVGACASPTSVSVSDVWVRPAPAGGETAAYLTVTNGGGKDDVLVGVSTPDAQTAGLHQTSTDASGMTGMAHTDAIVIPAGGTVELKAGGYHVMLTGVTRDLTIGGSIKLVLTFEQSGVINIVAQVKGG